jgi:hypothetical protein
MGKWKCSNCGRVNQGGMTCGGCGIRPRKPTPISDLVNGNQNDVSTVDHDALPSNNDDEELGICFTGIAEV